MLTVPGSESNYGGVMRINETEDQFRFSRGHPLAGWLLTAVLVAVVLCFLQPILAWGGQVARGDPVGQLVRSFKEATAGQICLVVGFGGLAVVLVVAAV